LIESQEHRKGNKLSFSHCPLLMLVHAPHHSHEPLRRLQFVPFQQYPGYDRLA